MTQPYFTVTTHHQQATQQPATGLAELTEAETWAFAQLLKRLSWAELRACAVDEAETYEARDAVAKLQRAFAEAGIAPR
jgi:hypothetical protein